MRTPATVVHGSCLTLALSVLLGCASAPAERPPEPSGASAQPSPGRGRPACQRLFVSPSGEPFRREPGGACPLSAWFAGADADHDGALSRAEFKADAARFFRSLDRDADGVLDAVEVQRYEREVLPEISGRHAEAMAAPHLMLAQFGGGMGGGGGGHGGGGRHGGKGGSETHQQAGPGSSPDGASRFGLLDEPEPVASADLNFDGRVTLAEFLDRASQRFDSLDADSSGRLTLPQLQARLAARGGERGGPPNARHDRRST